MRDVKVAIDPGHGGPDPGSVNGSFLEKDFTWQISKQLQGVLELHGIDSVFTRNEDEDPAFSVRNRRANDAGAKLIVSVHVNAFKDGSARGLKAYYWPENRDMLAMAKIIQRAAPYELYRNNALPVPAVPGVEQRSRNLLGAYTLPAVLIETAFISNDNDLAALQDKDCQQRIAIAILLGILSYGGRAWTTQKP